MYYGDHPADALGRAARRVTMSGAISLGAGVGVERRGGRENPKYAVIGDGKETVVAGPLAAVTRAFGAAGMKSHESTPGGKRVVTDPATSARLWELAGEEQNARDDLSRYAQRSGLLPSAESDWQARRRAEAEQTLRRVQNERRRLLRQDSSVAEAEAGKPGTNWTQVSPAARKKIEPIVAKYRKMAHGFTACVRDNRERFGDRAEQVCAVVKDMGKRSTKWRKGGKGKVSEADEVDGAAELIEEAVARLTSVGSVLGGSGVRALVLRALHRPVVEGVLVEFSDEADQLGESLLADLVVAHTLGGPGTPWVSILEDDAVAIAGKLREGVRQSPLVEMAWNEDLHRRDAIGRFATKLASIRPGEDRTLIGGEVRVKRLGDGYEVHSRGESSTKHKTPAQAAQQALDRTAQSRHPKSPGGRSYYRTHKEATRKRVAIASDARGNSPADRDAREARGRAQQDTAAVGRVKALKPGEKVELQGGGWVKRLPNASAGYQYSGPDGGAVSTTPSAEHAARQARKRNPKLTPIGGVRR